MSTMSPAYLSEDPSDEDLRDTSIHTMEQQIDKEIPKIIFKIKKYYMVCVQNSLNINFDISEIATKNILVYGTFNKESWDQEAKKYNYQYTDQVLENWK